MSTIILTQSSGAILGPISKLLGWIMNWIYLLLKNFGIENIGLTIIILTILIYMCMLPLTVKQQKFSKLQQKMQPEIKAIQDKYKGKKDQQSQMAMNEETQAVYSKYGVSPVGSCLQLLIQFPVFLALYNVINNVPAYVSEVKNVFSGLVDGIIATEGYQDTMTSFVSELKIARLKADFFDSDISVVKNFIVDAVYKMSSNGWDKLASLFPNLSDEIHSTQQHMNHMNYFLGLNISDSPFSIISSSLKNHSYFMIFLALLVPIISYASQMINVKLMPQGDASSDDSAMAKQMKTLNYTMPLFSLVLCFTVPVGLGIYWIFSSLTRCIQQFFVNKHIQNLDLDAVIAKNVEKRKKKLEKMGINENQIRNAGRMRTKSNVLSSDMSNEERDAIIDKVYEDRVNAHPNSLAAKANLVKDFNERNSR